MSTDTAAPLCGGNIDGIHNITELYLTRPDYELTMNSIPMPGTTAKVEALIFLLGAIGKGLLQGGDLGPSKPSITTLSEANPAHDVDVIRLAQGTSPALFLTKEMLEREVRITPRLYGWLCDFAEARLPPPIDENSVTRTVLKPLFFLWVMIWSDACVLDDGRRDWDTDSLVTGEGGGDTDVVVTRGLQGTNVGVKVAAIEAKTPRSCGHEHIVNFGKSGGPKDDALARQYIRHLMRCNKSMVDNDAPWSRTLTLGALMVYPGHFFPVAFREATERFVVFADAITIDEPWPQTREKLEHYVKAVSVVAAWSFMLVVTADEKHKQRWNGVCQRQVEQAVHWTTTTGEQLASPNRLIATLTRCWAVVSALVYQAAFSLLAALVPLERFKALVLPNGDELVVESTANNWRLPFNLTLPLPNVFHKSRTAQTFVFSSANIVVKVFDDVKAYAHEHAFYEKWSSILGSAIPTLHAHGRRIDDSMPFLIFSDEGERITDLTEDDRAIVQRSVLDVIHEEGWHHHDLAARNVLRKPSGGLCLIDFGMASKCERQGCDGFWE